MTVPTEEELNGKLTFRHESQIAAPPADVFAWHETPDALERLILPGEPMKVVESAGSLTVGSRVVLEGKVGLMKIRWVALHTEYEPPHLFADKQESGPFAYWYHRHRFLDDGQGGTLLRDEVTYLPPMGMIGRLLGGGMIESKLQKMFDYRHETTKAAFEVGD